MHQHDSSTFAAANAWQSRKLCSTADPEIDSMLHGSEQVTSNVASQGAVCRRSGGNMRSDAILTAREPAHEDEMVSEPHKPKLSAVRSIVQRVDSGHDEAEDERHHSTAVR